jgi:hypothetical protein
MNYLTLLILLCVLTACSGKAGGTSIAPAQAPSPVSSLSADPPAAVPAVQAPSAAPPPEVPEPAPESARPAARTPCAFAPLRKFAGRVVKWEGECVDGKADGYGALRAYPRADSEDKTVWIFFGKLRRGEPDLGVLDLTDGFQAGRFVGGEVTGFDDRDLAIEALEEGTKAATQVSERMKAAGNAGSAAFYEKKAKMLEIQLGD